MLSIPSEFEEASTLVTPEMVAESVACGPDAAEHIAKLQEHVAAGFDEIFVGQIGPNQAEFIDFYAREVLPHLA